MIYKRCKSKGCTKAPRCDHQWWIDVQADGERERGPVANYARLWPVGQALPRTKDEAVTLEALVRAWLSQGRPDTTPPGAAPPPDDTATLTIGDACDAYSTGHVAKMADKGRPSIIKRIKAEYAKRPISDLFERRLIRELLDEVEDETSIINRNRHLSGWSHLLTWCRVEYKLTGDSPFFHKALNPAGIRKIREGDGRKRRLKTKPVYEEFVLTRAFQKLDDGGVMVGRFYCALDAGLRRGEMLKLRDADVLWDHPLGKVVLHVRWGTAKNGHERFVVVRTARLLAFLKSRRGKAFPFGDLNGKQIETFREEWEAALLLSGLEEGHWSETVQRSAKGNTWHDWIRTKDADLHWHDLRHECGSRLAEKGVPLNEIKEMLGHRDLKTTQKYLNAQLESTSQNLGRAFKAMKIKTA